MAKKRGGLAGLYDRNKGLFRTAAILGGTALGGPAGGAAAGAAFRGLDRPGKRGIGFDVGQGLRGAAEGYTIGKTAIGAKQAISKMLAPKAAGMASYNAANVPGIGMGLGSDPATTGNFWYGGGQPPVDLDPFKLSQTTQKAAPKLGRVESILSKVEKYPKAFEMMQSALPDPQAQARIDAEMMRARSDEERARLERERFALEQRLLTEGGQRQANFLRMLMPSLSDVLGLNQTAR